MAIACAVRHLNSRRCCKAKGGNSHWVATTMLSPPHSRSTPPQYPHSLSLPAVCQESLVNRFAVVSSHCHTTHQDQHDIFVHYLIHSFPHIATWNWKLVRFTNIFFKYHSLSWYFCFCYLIFFPSFHFFFPMNKHWNIF